MAIKSRAVAKTRKPVIPSEEFAGMLEAALARTPQERDDEIADTLTRSASKLIDIDARRLLHQVWADLPNR